MRLIGAHARAKQLRSAANRLRWECEPDAGNPTYDLVAALGEIAETLAIIRQITRLLDRADLPTQTRIEFSRLLMFYAEYHEVAR